MGLISVAAFKPLAGREAELLSVLRERLPLLRRLGLATERPPINARSRSGVILHISEWSSADAVGRAHRTPEVLALWERFAACCEYVTLASLDEVRDAFATFDAVDG
jgi:hypothetical protein